MIDRNKIGSFLRELRNEKGLTQEELAEKYEVSSRSVSRWENGNTMPELGVLVELADYYEVDISEMIDGERKSENMDTETKETLLKVAEYEDDGKKRNSYIVIAYSCIGIIALIINIIMGDIELSMPDFMRDFLHGMTYGIAIGAMLLSIAYATGMMTKLYAFKRNIKEKMMN